MNSFTIPLQQLLPYLRETITVSWKHYTSSWVTCSFSLLFTDSVIDWAIGWKIYQTRVCSWDLCFESFARYRQSRCEETSQENRTPRHVNKPIWNLSWNLEKAERERRNVMQALVRQDFSPFYIRVRETCPQHTGPGDTNHHLFVPWFLAVRHYVINFYPWKSECQTGC